MFERFTDRARRVIVLAQEETRRLGHVYIGTEHLLLALSHDRSGLAGRALTECGLEDEAVRAEVEALVGRGDGTLSGQIPFTPGAKKAMELSLRAALELGHSYIGTEHLLLGVLREAEGPACEVVRRMGTEPAALEARVLAVVAEDPATAPGSLPASPPGRARRFSGLRRSGARGVMLPVPPDEPAAPGRGRLTVDARRALVLARSEALRLGHGSVGASHVLLGVLAEGEGRGARALAAAGVALDGAREAAALVVGPPGEVPDPLLVTPAVGEVVEAAVAEAEGAGLRLADSGHLVLGLGRLADGGDTAAVELLAAVATTPAALRAALDDVGPAA